MQRRAGKVDVHAQRLGQCTKKMRFDCGVENSPAVRRLAKVEAHGPLGELVADAAPVDSRIALLQSWSRASSEEVVVPSRRPSRRGAGIASVVLPGTLNAELSWRHRRAGLSSHPESSSSSAGKRRARRPMRTPDFTCGGNAAGRGRVRELPTFAASERGRRIQPRAVRSQRLLRHELDRPRASPSTPRRGSDPTRSESRGGCARRACPGRDDVRLSLCAPWP